MQILTQMHRVGLLGAAIPVLLRSVRFIKMLLLILVASNINGSRNQSVLIDGLNGSNQKSGYATIMKDAVFEAGIAMRNIGLQSDAAQMQREQERVKSDSKRFEDARKNWWKAA